MPRTVAFLNQKGGVGKTSTVHHLGGTLARRGLRVLAVDADPQASLTQGLLGPEVAEDLDPRETIAAIFDDSVCRPGPRPGASDRLREPVAPGRLRGRPALQSARPLGLRACSSSRSATPWPRPRDGFDVVLIDCPPHIQLWAWSALVAADGVVVPLQAEDYGRRA